MSFQTKTATLFARPRQSEATAVHDSGLPFAPECSICLGHHVLRTSSNRLNPGRIENGLLAWLPLDIPEQSCALRQLSDKAPNHPCVMIHTSACGHLLFCLQITSFGEGTIQDKYYDCQDTDHKNRMFNDYVAFEEPHTVAHNQLGLVEYRGLRMDKQSYVHLEFGFWIEWDNLNTFDGRALKHHSLATITTLYQQAEQVRQRTGSQSTERLASAEQRRSRSASPLATVSFVSSAPCPRPASTAPQSKRIVSPLGLPNKVHTFADASNRPRKSGPPTRPPQRAPAYSTVLPTKRKGQNEQPPESKRKAIEGNWRRSAN